MEQNLTGSVGKNGFQILCGKFSQDPLTMVLVERNKLELFLSACLNFQFLCFVVKTSHTKSEIHFFQRNLSGSVPR